MRQMRINTRIRPARFHIGAHACLFAESIGHSIFDFQSRKIQTLERTVLRRDFNFETLFGREPLLPSHCTSSGIQILLLSVRRVSHLDQHTLRQPAMQVQQQHETPIATHHHAGTQDTQIVRSDAADALHLLREIGLNPCGTWQEQMEGLHLQRLT